MQLKCKDIGMKCDFEVKGVQTEDEIMQLAALHARIAHKMEHIPPEVAAKVKVAIKR